MDHTPQKDAATLLGDVERGRPPNEGPASEAIDYRGLAAVIAAIAGVGVALSLGLPLLSVVLEARGISPFLIGINTATAGVAAILILPFVAPLARAFGTARLMLASFALMAVTLVAFYLTESFLLWFPLRFVFAAAITAIFALTEFWISSLAPEARRGLVIGIYTAVLSIGIAIGPLILALVGTDGIAPFLIGAAALIVAALPVAAVRAREPALPTSGERNLLRYVAVAPLALFAALVFGSVESGGTAILPLYGTAVGLSSEAAVVLVAAIAIGNVVSQVPIGYLADHVNRRLLLVGTAVIGAAGALAMPFVSHSFWGLFAVLFVTGGIVAGLYTVGLVHLGARYRGGDLASANAAFVMMYAIGMLVGPVTLGVGLDLVPPHGFPLAIAALFLLYIALAMLRLGRKGLAGAEPGQRAPEET